MTYSYARMEVLQSTEESAWFRLLSFRMREVLANEQAADDGGPRSSHTVYDLSQIIGRCPISTVHPEFPDVALMPTVLPASFFWLAKTPTKGRRDTRPDIKFDRPLCPEEHLMMQGWPSFSGPVVVGEHRNCANSMPGNAFRGSVSLAVFVAMISVLEWRPEEEISYDEGDACTVAEDLGL